jgi:hypothetical protein
MLKGWKMLAESCTKESKRKLLLKYLDCYCPLMMNLENQIYCVGCESWIFDNHKSPKKQKFGELVSLSGKQHMKLKHENSDVQLLNNAKSNIMNYIPKTMLSFDGNIRGIIERKLAYLAEQLDKESDIDNIKYF